MSRVLVIGYGNELRGDDALGPLLAAQVEQWNLPGVLTRIVRQLTPELSLDLAGSRFVLFIDAGEAWGENEMEVCSVQPAHEVGSFAHIGHPGVVLALTQSLFQTCPEACLLTIKAHSFEFGAPLSPGVQALLPSAARRIRDIIDGWLAV